MMTSSAADVIRRLPEKAGDDIKSNNMAAVRRTKHSVWSYSEPQLSDFVGGGAYASPSIDNLQDWNAMFGRDYRAFHHSSPDADNQLQQLSDSSFDNDGLQNWRSFIDENRLKRRGRRHV
jgi:hypothetical protein